MNFLRIKHRDGTYGNRGLVDWSDDGKEEFFGLELVIGAALARLQEVDPNWFALMLTHNNEEVRKITSKFLNTPIMEFDETGNAYK